MIIFYIVKIAVLSVIIISNLIDFIVSIILIMGIIKENAAYLFVWLIASLATTLISTPISLLSNFTVMDSIILVNTGKDKYSKCEFQF